MSLQSIIRWILPKDDKFFGLLEQHAAVVAETAALMVKLPFAAGSTDIDQVHTLEHRGDELVRAVILALEETFVTPIDREDIHHLSARLDDVLDNLYAAGQAFVSYKVTTKSPAMDGMLQLLAEATGILKDMLPNLRLHRFNEVAPARLKIIALEVRQDALYRGEMAALYNNASVDAKELLRQQAVLDALESSMDCCQDAADVLENIAIKHG